MSGSNSPVAAFTGPLGKAVLCKHARSNQRRSAKHKRVLHDTSNCEDLPDLKNEP